MKLIAYLRASTDKQDNSTDVQRGACETYCAAQGHVLVDSVPDEGMSGAVYPMDRPALASVVDRIKAGEADGLLVYKFDRLARKAWYTLQLVDDLDELGITVLSVTDPVDVRTAEGLLMLGVLASMAQYERALIRRRTKATLAMKKSRGERVGTIPYGYAVGADGKTLVPDEEEQRVVSQVILLTKAGYSSRVVADNLNEDGFENRAGGDFTKEQVRRILARAKEEGKV